MLSTEPPPALRLTRETRARTDGPLRWIIPAGVLALALLARLWDIDLTRFFNDQVWFIQSAANFADSGHFPLSSGLTFAAGTTGAPVRHPPLVTLLLTLPVLVSRNPVWVSGCVAALDAFAAVFVYLTGLRLTGRRAPAAIAGALYALSPAAIVYGRMVWNVDFVPFFAAVGLFGLVDFWVGARPWSLALSLLGIGCATELHPVNAVLLLVWLGVLAASIFAQPLRRCRDAVPAGVWGVPTDHLFWRWSSSKARRAARPLGLALVVLLATIAPYLILQLQDGWVDVRNLVAYLGRPKVFDLSAVEQAGVVAGPAIFHRLLGEPTGSPLYDGVTWALIGLVLIGLILAARRGGAGWILCAWVLVPILAGLRHTGDVVPHYLLAIVPAIAVLLALALDLGRRVRLGWACGLAACALLAANYVHFQQQVASNTRETDYGMPLRYSLQAAQLVRQRVGDQPFYLAVPFLWEQTVPALAGVQTYHWYWDRSVFVFPHTDAWYLAQNDSFGHDFLSRRFGPAEAVVPTSSGAPAFSLFHLPPAAAAHIFGGPGFTPQDAQAGGITLQGLLADHLAAGQPSEVLLEWRIDDPARVPGHLSQFAHLVDASRKTTSTNADLYDVREAWQPGDVVVSAFNLNPPANTPGGGYWLETGFYDTFSRQPLGAPVRIGPLKVAGAEPPPEPVAAPLATLGEGEMALLRADWQGADVGVDWQALRKPAASYTVFVHAVDANGKLVAQWDGLPRGGSYPTTLWDAGETVHDVYPLGLAPTPGVHLEIGMYTQPDIRRLPVVQNDRTGDSVLVNS